MFERIFIMILYRKEAVFYSTLLTILTKYFQKGIVLYQIHRMHQVIWYSSVLYVVGANKHKQYKRNYVYKERRFQYVY